MLKRVLLATNFQPSNSAATQLATTVVNHLGAELHAVYVIGDYFRTDLRDLSGRRLGALKQLLHVLERMAQLLMLRPAKGTHIDESRPYQEIVKLAAKIQADLIVIGQRSRIVVC